MPKKAMTCKKTAILKKKARPIRQAKQKKIHAPTRSMVVLATFALITSMVFVGSFKRVSNHNVPPAVASIAAPKPALSTINNITKSSAYAPVLESIALPARLKIPTLKLDASIEKVGITTSGSMGVPVDPMKAGWYEFGPRPGEIGSAVIDGHVDWWYGATGVFANLHKVKIGDKIAVQDDKGIVISFVVRKIQNYGAKDNAASIFISNDGKAHLNLITCAGIWDKQANQYTKRLVVFADKEY